MANPHDLTDTEKELMAAMKAGKPVDVDDDTGDVRVLDETDEDAAISDPKPERDASGKFVKKTKAEEGVEEEVEEGVGEPEKVAKDDEETKGATKDTRMVPIQALDKERQRRVDATGEVAQLREQMARMQADMARMAQARQQPQPGQPNPFAQPSRAFPGQQRPMGPEPDPLMDPDGWKAWNAEQRRRDIAEAQRPYLEMQRQRQQADRAQQAEAMLHNYAHTSEDAFRKEHPDRNYDGALEHMRKKVVANFKLMGFSDQEAEAQRQRQEREITQLAMMRGVSPAALIYNLALNDGYNDLNEPEQEDAEDKITRLAEAQRRTASPARASGGAKGELTVEVLGKMSESEMAKLQKERPEEFRRLMGG